jgi:hypothetical protein
MKFKYKYSWLHITMIIGMLLMSVTSYAQTLTTDAPPQQKLWEVFLKVLFPAVWTAVAPWITGLVTSGIKRVPAPVQVVISSVIGALMAGAAGAIPDFPLTIESAATMGVAGGATGQLLVNMNPIAMHPKTEATINKEG